MTASEARDRLEWLYEEGHTLSAETKEALETAIEALEKQIPMKPMPKEISVDGRAVTPCGNCGNIIGYFDVFCSTCGQRIDWSKK